MTSINMDVFYNKLVELIDGLYEKESKNIEAAAKICAESIENGGVVHVFGSGHSVGFGLEIQNRPGSLAPIHTIETSDFVLKGKTTLEDFKNPDDVFERRPEIADKLYDLYAMDKNDAFIIISNSGINGVVIDMAITAKQRGHKVIVVTSWQHTSAEDSRHPSGRKLYELGDVVIDNCGPQGDALLETERGEKICSVSSITGSFIAQGIAVKIASILKEKGAPVPVYLPDTKENKEYNKNLKEKYQDRV